MTIEEMRARKTELGLTCAMIAERAGLPLSTVQKIFSGTVKAPRKLTIDALVEVLQEKTERTEPGSYAYRLQEETTSMVREESARYIMLPKGGGHTVKDYLALPEEKRAELIDGVFYDLAAPRPLHQVVAGYLHKKFLDFVLENNGPCYPIMSPVDVYLDEDDKTVVQPDIVILCDRKKLGENGITGAPDLVVEVLSPSTRRKDMHLKLYKYGNAGVREYWMIDPAGRTVVRYDLENMEPPLVCGFDAKVPVGIWGGKCEIDFRELTEALSFVWGEEHS